MYLIVHEVQDTALEVTLTYSGGVTQVSAIRPYLYLHNNPSGSVKVSLKKGSTVLSSKTIPVATIISNIGTTDDYIHGYITFELDSTVFISDDTDYKIAVEGVDGYAFSGSSYIGWVSEFEDIKNDYDVTIVNAFDYPYGYEIWSYKDV